MPPYVIYHKQTTKILHKRNGMRTYASKGSAKAGLTRASCESQRGKADISNKDDYAIAEYSYFREHIEKTETVKNLMSGKDVVQSVNTPLCCDPSSETYWCM